MFEQQIPVMTETFEPYPTAHLKKKNVVPNHYDYAKYINIFKIYKHFHLLLTTIAFFRIARLA